MYLVKDHGERSDNRRSVKRPNDLILIGGFVYNGPVNRP